MNTSTWILVLILFSSIVFLTTTWVILKFSLRLEKRIRQVEKFLLEDVTKNQVDVGNSVSTGLVKGLQQVKDDDERHLKLLEMGRHLQSAPLKVMNQNSVPKSFNTGGELIPSNLTKEEEEILRMYYDRSNER